MTDDINENGGAPTDPAAGTGAFFTKKEILDFVTANPPMGDIPPSDEPLDTNAPRMAHDAGARAYRGHGRGARFVTRARPETTKQEDNQ